MRNARPMPKGMRQMVGAALGLELIDPRSHASPEAKETLKRILDMVDDDSVEFWATGHDDGESQMLQVVAGDDLYFSVVMTKRDGGVDLNFTVGVVDHMPEGTLQ